MLGTPLINQSCGWIEENTKKVALLKSTQHATFTCLQWLQHSTLVLHFGELQWRITGRDWITPAPLNHCIKDSVCALIIQFWSGVIKSKNSQLCNFSTTVNPNLNMFFYFPPFIKSLWGDFIWCVAVMTDKRPSTGSCSYWCLEGLVHFWTSSIKNAFL